MTPEERADAARWPSVAPAYRGTLDAGDAQVWACNHRHATAGEATQCAAIERRARQFESAR